MIRPRLTYLLDRARSIRMDRLWGVAVDVGRVVERPALFVLIDLLYCSARYDCAFQDYKDWDFALLNAEQRRTFMTHPKSDHIARRYNTGTDRFVLRDKVQFNTRFAELVRREWIDLRTASRDELELFAARHPTAIAKVPDSLGGYGIGRVDMNSVVDASEYREALIEGRQFLLEEVIRQHPDMSRLNDSSVNTVRIVTFVSETEVYILARVLKIGAGGDVDNFSAGGMYTMLDARGVVLYPAFDANDVIHETHPISGVPIVGFAVPHFDAVRALVRRAALSLKDVPYVGWDVAITAAGPLIVEGNYNTGVFQAKPRASGVRRGLLPVYAAVVQF